MTEKQTNASGRRVYSILPQIFLLILLIVSACQSSTKEQQSLNGFDANKDYFPDKVEINHSVGFDITYEANYKTLHLFRHYNDLVDTVSYVLVQRGTPAPQTDLSVIEIPVESLVSMSTTHLGMFKMLDAMETLKGIEIAQYVSSEVVKEAVAIGKITEVAPAGAINVETVINMNTDVLLGVGYPNSQNESYQQLERAGIPVLLNADWQETNLLGRAEWVKMLAALLNKEQLVNQKFAKIEKEYNSVLNLVETRAKDAPLTITGIAQGDAWHVAGGRSFAYNLLKLVKVRYPWKDDTSTGSLLLDFETVYEVGLKAEYWVAPSNARTLDEVLERDSRYADFKSFKTGNIYNVYGRYTEGGGNDYYESAVMSPAVVLRDIVKIFHPDLLPDHQLIYYSRLK